MTKHYNGKFYVYHLYDVDPSWFNTLIDLGDYEYNKTFSEFNATVYRIKRNFELPEHIVSLANMVGWIEVYEIIEFESEQDYMFFLLKYA